MAKHISVCIVESPTASSKKISDKPQSLCDSLITYEDRYRDCLCQNQLTNEVNGLKTKISNLQISINSFETTSKDHDSILYLYGKSTDLNEQYQREIAENKRYINILEQKLFTVEKERDSLQVAIKLVVQDKYYQRENEAQPPVRDHIPHSHKKYPQEWNKVSLSKQYPNTKQIQLNPKPLPIPVNNRYANLVDEGEYNVANQPEQNHECPTTENSQIDNSETPLSPCESIQPVTTPKQPTTLDHSKSQQPLQDRNEQDTSQKARLNKPHFEQCSASEHHKVQQPPQNSNPNHQNSIILIGDSMIKNIIAEKITQRKVYKYTYSGKTADQIASEVENINLHEAPSHVIIHAGTNDLSLDSSNDCIHSIENLCLSVQNKFANAKIGVSSIIVRDDVSVNDKIQEVNEGIKESCRNRNYSFIDNSNIKLNALNGSKLHLNTRGSALLASRFIKFLRGELSPGPSNQYRTENFRLKETLRQMQNLIRRISMQTSKF